MQSNPMAEFFERIGQRPVRSASAWWHEVQPGVLLSFPYHCVLNPPEEEIRTLMRERRLRAVRFPTPLTEFGFVSTLELNTNSQYDFDALQKSSRRQTRQGLANCVVGPISFDDLHRQGMPLNRDTAERQGRNTPYTDPTFWRRYCEAGKNTPGLHAWVALLDGELGSYVVFAEFDGWMNCLVTHSSTKHLPKRPSNALLFEVSRQFLHRAEGHRICYGLGSLEEVKSLDEFKIRMGWTLRLVKQRLVVAKPIRAVFALMPEPLLRLAPRLAPRSYTVRKAVGMIRLYRQQTRVVPRGLGAGPAIKEATVE